MRLRKQSRDEHQNERDDAALDHLVTAVCPNDSPEGKGIENDHDRSTKRGLPCRGHLPRNL